MIYYVQPNLEYLTYASLDFVGNDGLRPVCSPFRKISLFVVHLVKFVKSKYFGVLYYMNKQKTLLRYCKTLDNFLIFKDLTRHSTIQCCVVTKKKFEMWNEGFWNSLLNNDKVVRWTNLPIKIKGGKNCVNLFTFIREYEDTMMLPLLMLSLK